MAIAADEASTLKKSLAELPANQRELIELAYFRGLTHTEIAAENGNPTRHREDTHSHGNGGAEGRLGDMTGSHDDFAALAAAYAINALDRDEQRAFEAHLATCAQCQADVADFRRVSAGLGLSVEVEAPPAALKAKNAQSDRANHAAASRREC